MHGWQKVFKNPEKKKHKLYNKFLTKRTSNNERKVQGMQVIIWSSGEKIKKLCYAKRLSDCENNTEKAWDIIKQVIGKTKYI